MWSWYLFTASEQIDPINNKKQIQHNSRSYRKVHVNTLFTAHILHCNRANGCIKVDICSHHLNPTQHCSITRDMEHPQGKPPFSHCAFEGGKHQWQVFLSQENEWLRRADSHRYYTGVVEGRGSSCKSLKLLSLPLLSPPQPVPNVSYFNTVPFNTHTLFVVYSVFFLFFTLNIYRVLSFYSFSAPFLQNLPG